MSPGFTWRIFFLLSIDENFICNILLLFKRKKNFHSFLLCLNRLNHWNFVLCKYCSFLFLCFPFLFFIYFIVFRFFVTVVGLFFWVVTNFFFHIFYLYIKFIPIGSFVKFQVSQSKTKKKERKMLGHLQSVCNKIK